MVGNSAGEGFPHVVWQPTNPPLVAPVAPEDDVADVADAEFPQEVFGIGGAKVADVDAAIFTLDLAAAQGREASPAIVGQTAEADLIEAVTASALPAVGDLVRKRGFVTRVTHGIVIDAHLVCEWRPGGPNHYLAEQALVNGIATGDNPSGLFGLPGDSGSLVLAEGTPTAVGLLYGRNEGEAFAASGKRVVINKMRNVELALGITPVW